MTTIKVLKLIGTPNAILHPFGMEVYEAIIKALQSEKKAAIDMKGIRNATSAFFHASVGNLYRELGESYFEQVNILGVEDRPDWKEKIKDSIELVKHPDRETDTQLEIAALFKN